MLATLLNAWTAFSPLATVVGLAGIGMIVVALLGLTVLPDAVKKPLVGLGLALLVTASIYQAGQAKGAHDAFAVEAARSLAAEKNRAEIAERTIAADRAQAAKDRAAVAADNSKLRKLLDDLQAHGGSGVALPRDLARRLRDL